MKKLTSTSLGGAPIYKDDLRTVFNSELWEVVQGLLASLDADVQGIIVSGCVCTNNAGNFDMTAGIVYLNGEFMRIAAATNQAFTKYIVPSTAVNDDRTFADGTVHTVAVTKGAELSGSIPGSGQYITISSLTPNKNTITRKKIIPIGSWDMDTTAFVNVTHGISDISKIRSMSAVITNDAGTSVVPLALYDYVANDGTIAGGVGSAGASSLALYRKPSSLFDDAAFSGSGNRGYVIIDHYS